MRVKMRWSGFQGGPGYSVFHLRDFDTDPPDGTDAQNAVDKIDTFAEALKGLIPYQTALTVENEVEVLEETTGELVDVLSSTPAAAHNATVSLGPTFAGPVGAVINWKTAGVRGGRRIRGRTFLVPLLSQNFDINGTLTSAALTTLNAAATALRDTTASPDLGVWARPTPIKDIEGNPTGEYNPDGVWFVANAHSIPDMAAVLRSRRD
jgi:hypothetical protein